MPAAVLCRELIALVDLMSAPILMSELDECPTESNLPVNRNPAFL